MVGVRRARHAAHHAFRSRVVRFPGRRVAAPRPARAGRGRRVRCRSGARQPLGIRRATRAQRGGASAHPLPDPVPGVGGAALGRSRPEHGGDDRVRDLGVGHDARPRAVLGCIRATRSLGALPAGLSHRGRGDDADRSGRDERAALRAARRRGVAPALRNGGGFQRQPRLRRQPGAQAAGVGRRHAEDSRLHPERARHPCRRGWRASTRTITRRFSRKSVASGPTEERAYSLDYRVRAQAAPTSKWKTPDA